MSTNTSSFEFINNSYNLRLREHQYKISVKRNQIVKFIIRSTFFSQCVVLLNLGTGQASRRSDCCYIHQHVQKQTGLLQRVGQLKVLSSTENQTATDQATLPVTPQSSKTRTVSNVYWRLMCHALAWCVSLLVMNHLQKAKKATPRAVYKIRQCIHQAINIETQVLLKAQLNFGMVCLLNNSAVSTHSQTLPFT